MKVTLSVTDGPHRGRVFEFREHDTFIVGRSKDAHFRLPVKDKTISRFHFLVEVNPPSCRLLDMASTNGTFVNGREAPSADLEDGDVILGGRTTFALAIVDDVDPGPSTVVDGPIALSPTQVDLAITQHAGAAASEFRPPEYAIGRELGRGGMGIVHLAHPASGGPHVAVKTITPAVAASNSTLGRFLREASILRRLDHPNIVRFLEFGHSGGHFYFAMEYVPGVDSAEILKEGGPLAVGRAVELACQVLDGLTYAHALGYVHRDIKPNNLLVGVVDGREVAKLADFGLARAYQASPMSGLTLAGQVGGTSGYLAPEQITNFRDSKPISDIYGLAATLYHLLTGSRPHDLPHGLQRQLLVILQEDPVPIRSRRPGVPEALAGVIHRGLARNPADRFADAPAMLEALGPFRRAP